MDLRTADSAQITRVWRAPSSIPDILHAIGAFFSSSVFGVLFSMSFRFRYLRSSMCHSCWRHRRSWRETKAPCENLYIIFLVNDDEHRRRIIYVVKIPTLFVAFSGWKFFNELFALQTLYRTLFRFEQFGCWRWCKRNETQLHSSQQAVGSASVEIVRLLIARGMCTSDTQNHSYFALAVLSSSSSCIVYVMSFTMFLEHFLTQNLNLNQSCEYISKKWVHLTSKYCVFFSTRWAGLKFVVHFFSLKNAVISVFDIQLFV